ncbi:hypothetical protein, conserved [Babesia bigemina]|uniref:Uncharacterized protein n=1 Tax=Babesia bigemina TaxID=5866 RepID=A0A061BQF1_BABBI|nr:hypothetical protein, conserved [Babesia bigemina]CDR71698.1 hypothetical protein, conserved [Babesia bigemina]|eukprot:XP_012770644.1 hypothetical protein, conserved [Babesia bigemina]
MGVIMYGAPCTECKYKCKTFQECNCCPWCCEKCSSRNGCHLCNIDWYYRGRSKKDCHYKGCTSQTKQCPDIKKCQCTCCKKKCLEQTDACSAPATQLSPGPSDTQLQATSERQLSAVGTEEDSSKDSNPDASTSFRPSPQAIAAVIVAIIVAIILLDLCIFRFPVGRNIRDFLVRKIPFCIAFYS